MVHLYSYLYFTILADLFCFVLLLGVWTQGGGEVIQLSLWDQKTVEMVGECLQRHGGWIQSNNAEARSLLVYWALLSVLWLP